MTPAQAGQLAEKIAQAVQQISEIDEAQVVVNNDRALVAVRFDAQYSAGLDDRMKQQITETVQKVDDGLKDVEITGRRHALRPDQGPWRTRRQRDRP